MIRLRRPALILGLMIATGLTACDQDESRVPFDGQYFRSKVAKVDGDRQQIRITVRPVSASLDGALEAGRYEAIRYCVLTYGNSEVDWQIGPDDDPDTHVIDGDVLTLRGSCRG